MTTAYPTGLDSLSNPGVTDPRTNPSHAAQHANANDAIEAIQAALGIGPFGTGDEQHMYYATTAQKLSVKDGTAASPDTTVGPLLKVERLMGNVPDGSLGGDACEQLAAINAIAVGTTALTAQPVGVFGGALHSGTTIGTVPRRPDAVGVYGTGRITGSGIGVGIGVCAYGRRDTNTANTTGIEVGSLNYTATPGAYSQTAFSGTIGMWITALGDADSGCGINFGNPFGRQYKVGIGFNAQVSGGLTGGVADSSIRDDSSSTYALDIRGTHSFGLDLGLATIGTFAIRLPNTATGVGGIYARNAAGSANVSLFYFNDFDNIVIGGGGSTSFFNGHVQMQDTKHIILGTTTGSKIGSATTQKLAFWNATPVVQPTAVIDATDAASVITQLNALLSRMRTVGLIAA